MGNDRTSLLRPTQALFLPLAALVVAATIAACGHGTQTPQTARTQTGTHHIQARLVRSDLNFSKCMRSHGVPKFPDLTSTGMHIGADGAMLTVNGVSVSAPAFQSARQKCQKYLPSGIEPGPAKQAQQYAQSLHFSKCMRSHGVSNYPDPQASTGSHGNNVVELRGVKLDSPVVRAALEACGGGPKGPARSGPTS